MTDIYTPPPAPGADPPWGDDLNTTINWLHSHVTTLEEQIPLLQGQIDALETRLTAEETKPEYLFNSAPWTFNNNPPPATANQVRLDNAQGSLATIADFRKIDSDGADRSSWMQLLDVGSFIRIQDWDNSAVFYRYRVTGKATFNTDNAQVPITWDSGAGVLPNAKVNVGFIVAFTEVSQ